MKTTIFTSLFVAAAMSVAPATEEKTDKTLGEKTAETLDAAKEKTMDAGRAIADTTKKAANALVDAVTPDADARQVPVELTDNRIDMPKRLEPGKTAFVVKNTGSGKHNFEVKGEGIDKKFMMSLSPNETKTLHVDLKSGAYEICSPGEGGEEPKLNLTVK